jgi:hypothetical protein
MGKSRTFDSTIGGRDAAAQRTAIELLSAAPQSCQTSAAGTRNHSLAEASADPESSTIEHESYQHREHNMKLDVGFEASEFWAIHKHSVCTLLVCTWARLPLIFNDGLTSTVRDVLLPTRGPERVYRLSSHTAYRGGM